MPGRHLLVSLVLLLAPAAHASTVNLRWDSCWGDGGAQNRSFACDTNTGSQSIVGSFVPFAAVHGVVRVDFSVQIQFATPTVPSWWMFKNPGSCRQASLSVRALPPLAAAQCIDWASSAALGVIASYNISTFTPNLVLLTGASVVSTEAAADVVAGQEYFAFQLRIDNLKTVGPGACGGCNTGACIYLRSVQLHSADGSNNPFLGIGIAPGDQVSDARALWQPANAAPACGFPVPASNRTWGELKALYR